MTHEEAAHIVDVAFSVPLAVRRIGENRTYHEDEIREAKNMAIKALEQEPCEDAVSRKALISHIENQSRKWGEDYDAQQILGDIEDMPSVKPQEPKWIPVSERLPEEGGRYLAYTWSHEIEMAQYVDGYWNIKTPISAWMPLPEPYKDEYRQVDVMEIEDLERGIYTVKKMVLTDDNMS